MKKISHILTGIGTIVTLGAARIMNVNAWGVREGAEAAKTDDMPRYLFGPEGVITNITNTILYIVGIIAIIMLIFGGIKYITSGGDSQKVKDAKNTILYAIVGLVVALLSFAIVNFVLNALGAQSTIDVTQ